MNEPTDEEWKYHNTEQLEDALLSIYNTIIINEHDANLRGIAIRAIDEIIVNIRGESAVDKIQSAPLSARLRASEIPALRKFGDDLKGHFFGVEE